MQALCHICGTSREVKPTAKGNARPPRGWKSIEGTLTCSDCWGKTYRIAAITIPVAHAEWDVFRPALKQAQEAVTALSNWAVRKLLGNDVTRASGETKLPPMPAIYLYGEAPECHAWCSVSKGTGGAVLQAVEQRYRAVRYDMIWRASAAPPVYRYPQPIPLRPDGYKLGIIDERVCAEVLLSGQRHRLTLAGGHQYRRQRKAIEWLIEHSELMAQASLYEVEAHTGDHRPTNTKRDNGGGVRRSKRLLLKVVGWLPIKADSIPDNTLSIHTDAESLLVAVDNDGERVWTYNADHAKRIAMRHSSHLGRLSRLSDDRKAERRKPARESRSYRNMLQERSSKDHSRLTSLCHEVSASVVQFAARRKCAEITYDDAERKFCASFPWAKLGLMIEQKSKARGITVRFASGPVTEKSTPALAEEQGQ